MIVQSSVICNEWSSTCMPSPGIISFIKLLMQQNSRPLEHAQFISIPKTTKKGTDMDLPVTSIGYGQPDFSLLPAVGDPGDFDYGAFLQEDDPDYMAEDSSNSTTTNRLTDTSIQTITPQSTLTIIRNDSASGASSGSPPKQRLERRGHTKSRRGCFNCKRRRIKV